MPNKGLISRSCLAVALALLGNPVAAQQVVSSTPMSAIDWLSDSVTLPPPSSASAILPPDPNEPATSTGALVAEVTMSLLEAPVLDAVGLLPASTTGLARDLWGYSRPDDLARRISNLRIEMYPSMQSLLQTLLLAELDPPKGARYGDDRLFLARVDRLLATGALDQAEALLTRAGAANARIFRRSFDTALLLGHEDRQCAELRASPDLSPTFTARVFCLARSGEWDAAVLTLGTGRALGYINDADDALLARFLDPELFEGEPPLPHPDHPTPLTFRMFEAIGQHISTRALPLAFSQSDLRSNIGWKARAEAGERLARVGSVSPNQLLGLYSERKPAASGGVWDRMSAVRTFEAALTSGDTQALEAATTSLWQRLEESALEVPFAQLFGPRLARVLQHGAASETALHMGLLSDDAERVAQGWRATDIPPKSRLLLEIALGNTAGSTAYDARSQAVLDGFNANVLPVRLHSLIESERVGEAILRAIELYDAGTEGSLDELADALAFFRLVGLERVARQAALEFLILERRG